MALAERILASNTADTGTGSATTISVAPTGQVADDWLIFFLVSVGGTVTHSNTAGSLSRAHAVDFIQGSSTAVSTWKIKATSSSTVTYSFDIGATTRRIAVAVRAYSGGDLTDIVELAQAFTGFSGQSLGITSVTPADINRWHLLFEASSSAAGVGVTFGQPGSYVEKHDFATTHATNAEACLGWAELVLPSAAATGIQTFSISGGATRTLAGGSILLKPAATVPIPNPFRRSRVSLRR